MDLYITISDENGDVLRDINIYRDGSDLEGAENIINMINNKYPAEDFEVLFIDEFRAVPSITEPENEYWLVSYTCLHNGHMVADNAAIDVPVGIWLDKMLTEYPDEHYKFVSAVQMKKDVYEKLAGIVR